MSRKEQPTAPRQVWTYWISRDSVAGELSGKVCLWYRKPMRVKHSYRATWVCTDHRDPGCLGEHALVDVQRWFGTLPETDLELIRVDTHPTAEQLAASAKT